MKKILSAVMAGLIGLPLQAQSGGYDPENPGDPNAQYLLELTASPKAGGDVSPSVRRYVAVGETVTCTAKPKDGYKFTQWMIGETIVSADSRFEFTMPDHNELLTAHFDYTGYNPDNPDDPYIDGYQHKVTVFAQPAVAGSFNASSFYLTEGETESIYAYARTGYRFVSWKQIGVIISTDNPLEIKMGTENLSYTATFVYDPQGPGNPGANMFNRDSGELVIDDFERGHLNDAISAVVGSEEDLGLVSSIIVIGVVNEYELGFTSGLIDCRSIDLARTTGLSLIPARIFEGMTQLDNIVLPASVEKIGRMVFNDCPALTQICVYSGVPPVIDETSFGNLDKAKVSVKVPADAIPLYRQTDGWKQFNILPLGEETRSVTVNLPADANGGKYKNLTLELYNVSNGQAVRYILTERNQYTFTHLIEGCKYSLSVKNSRGAIVGTVEPFELTETNKTINFDTLRESVTVSAKLSDNIGNDLSDRAIFTWKDESGNYLGQGAEISDMTEGEILSCEVSVDNGLIMQYRVPEPKLITVSAGAPSVRFDMVPYDKINISGHVRDNEMKAPVSGAKIRVTQKINASVEFTNISTSNDDGTYDINIIESIPFSLDVSADMYTAQSIDGIIDADKLNIDDILLSRSQGPFVYPYIYYSEASENETAGQQTSDYSDFMFSAKNRETNKFYENLPVIRGRIDLSGTDIETEFVLTVSSNTGSFDPVEVNGMILNGSSEIKAYIVEYGGLDISFKKSLNESDVALLFDAAGKKIAHKDFNDKSLSLRNLEKGEYDIVCLGKTNRIENLSNMAQLAGRQLIENKDYILKHFTVGDGRISSISIEEIPLLAETPVEHMKGKNNVTANKTAVSIGENIVIKADIAFKSDCDPQDVQCSFLIPDGCEYVENSIICSPACQAVYDGRCITVKPLGRSTQIKFCIMPVSAGEYRAGASVSYKIDGKRYEQSYSPCIITAKNLTINVPETTRTDKILVSGVAPAGCSVDVTDNGTVVSTAKSNYNGKWKAELPIRGYNCMYHNIQAVVTTNDNITLLSEVKNCFYNKNEIDDFAEKVSMQFFQPEQDRNLNIVFDHSKAVSGPNYTMYTGQTFTFLAEFSDNSPEKISDVRIYVYSIDNSVTHLDATYDIGTDRWVAKHVFYDANAPVNAVACASLTDVERDIDFNQVRECVNLIENMRQDVNSCKEIIRERDLLVDGLMSEDDVSSEEIDNLIRSAFDIDLSDVTAGDEMPDEEYADILARISDVDDSSDTSGESEDDEVMDMISHYSLFGTTTFSFEGNEYACEVTPAENLDADRLLSDGYSLIPTLGGETLLYKYTDGEYDYIDFVNNYRKHIYPSRQSRALAGLSPEAIGRFFNAVAVFTSKLIQDENVLMALSKEYEYSKKTEFNKLQQQRRDVEKALRHNKLREECTSDVFEKLRILNGRRVLTNGLRGIDKKISKNLIVSRKMLGVLKAIDIIRDLREYLSLMADYGRRAFSLTVPELCDKLSDPEKVRELFEKRINRIQHEIFDFIMGQALRKAVYVASDIALSKIPLLGIGLSYLEEAAEDVRKDAFMRYTVTELESIEINIQSINKKCKKKDEKPEEPKPTPEVEIIPEPIAPPVKVAYDPSGYVYEGVPSNRLEGVTATVFYKEYFEDMYGDVQEKIIKWDAEEFAQENPLFTDKDGLYAWDVPQGLWQVKFEKGGYETAYSDWLPVPPPQLDVNIAMTQLRQPEVCMVNAYTDGITIEFDKYMLPSTLTPDNILVTCGGNVIDGEIILLDAEAPLYEDGAIYASRLRFVPQTPFGDESLILTISNRVQSYAGIRMAETFTQSFDIKPQISGISASDEITVIYGGQASFDVTVQPAVDAKGMLLLAASSSPMIAEMLTPEVAIDNTGNASIAVSGLLPGTAVITLSVKDYEISKTVRVNVIMSDEEIATATPVASVGSGCVKSGTEVFLSCETPDAVIYYTLDGSCPCGDGRIRYTGSPIVLVHDVTLKIMAEADGMTESDIAEYIYTVDQSGIEVIIPDNGPDIYPLPLKERLYVSDDGHIIDLVEIVSMNGRIVIRTAPRSALAVLDIAVLPKGYYLIVIISDNHRYIRKVLKS